jgi:DNA-binding response OmpR family regulator
MINNGPINLTSKEFDLLVYFIANKNRVIQKKCIGRAPVGDSADQFDNFDFIYNHVKTLERNCCTL